MGRALRVAASLLTVIFIVSTVALAASSPGVEWEKTYDVLGNDCGLSMQPTSDGGYILAGTSGSLACLVKVDSGGNTQWKNTYAFGDFAKGYSVRQASDGGYVVAGSTRQDGKDKILLFKADQNGTQLWNKTYGDASPGSIEGAGTSVRQASDGGYVVAAQYPYPSTGRCGVYLLRTDSSGNMQRSVMASRNGDITLPSIEQTSDGGYIMAATIYDRGYQGTQADYGIYLIKFDRSGSTQWEKTLGGSGDQYCGSDGSVKQSRDGGYIISGRNGSAYLAKTDSSGNLLWSKKYNESSGASSVTLADDGGYALAGTDSAGRLMVIKTGSTGGEEWREATGPGACEAASIQKTGDGGYAASGTSGGDIYLVKLKAPAKSTGSLFQNNGDLFSGLDMFKTGPTDMWQTSPAGNGLFAPSSLKMLNLIGDTPATRASSPFEFPPMPSFGFNTGFPKMASSFGSGGWPYFT